jgi:hypothetical protein
MNRAKLYIVKTWAKTTAFGLALLLGIGVGISAYHVHVLDQAAANSKTRWLICQAHQSALYDHADKFRQKFGRWPTNVQELVENNFLPEYSEIHLCPSQIDTFPRTDYSGSTWVEQNHTGPVAYYTSTPYRFHIEGDKFSVACTFDITHTQ